VSAKGETRVVAAGAGFAGDRIEPAVALAGSGRVDCVVLECLAERTLVQGLHARAADPDAGYDRRLRRRLAPLLGPAREHGCRIVANLGSANPAAAAREIARLASELGLGGLRVAAVVGDDVLDRAAEVRWAGSVEGGTWLGMHAYLGLEPIAEALAGGADVVVTGRTADAALFAAPLRDLLDGTPDALAGALAVGHLLECAGQLTGGNFAPPGGAGPPAAELAALGYPLARVAPDGSAELGKLPGTGGRLDRLTCTLQLLYEVHDPRRYFTPDAIVDFGDVAFAQLGPDRVGVSGARAVGRPPTLKVSGFLQRPGVIVDAEIGYAGRGALDRARTACETLALRLAMLGVERSAVDVVGVDAILGPASGPLTGEPPEVRAHVSAVCPEAELAQAVEDEVYALTLAGPAGGAGIRCERRPALAVVDGFLAPEHVAPELVWERAA
jgi:hypothetical protein